MSTTVGNPMFDLPQRPGLPAPAGAGGEAEGMGLSDIVRVFKQRKLMIIISTLVLYGLVAVATLATLFYFPAYTSEAYFEMLPPEKNDYIREDVMASPEIMEQMLQTEARKLKQLDILYDVLKQPEVKNTAYFDWYDKDVAKAALGLQKDVVAAPVPETRLIRVALASKKKQESLLIVEKIVKEFEDKYESQSKDQNQDRSKLMNDQVLNVTKELTAKRAQLATLRATGDLSRIQSERGQSEDNISYLTKHLSDLDGQIASLEAQALSYQGLNPEDLPLTAEHRLVIDSDPILRYYTTQVKGLDVQINSLKLRLGQKHRDMIQLERQREEYKGEEMARREELVDQVRNRQIEQVRQSLAEMQAIQSRVSERLTEAQGEERDLDQKMQRYKEVEADAQQLEKQLEEMNANRRKVDFIANDKSMLRLRLVQRPKEAVKASRPDLPIWLGGGAFLALAGAIGLAFLRELTDTAIRTPSDIGRHAHLPLLGSVPRLEDEETDVDKMELVVREAPASLVAEAFRKIRTNLQFSGPADTQRTILVTSAGAEDGKTSIATNLAITMASANKRVLLVDCNFRRPAIRGLFDGTRPEGLSNILIGQGSLNDYVTPTNVPNLHVLTSGPMPPNGAELLGSPRMQELITSAAARFDHVIFDGPPILLMSDASVLAMQVQGVIAVVAAEEVSRGELKRLRDQLEMIGARVVGVVLNGVRARAGGYFKRQYREFYDYTSDETVQAELPAPPPDKPG